MHTINKFKVGDVVRQKHSLNTICWELIPYKKMTTMDYPELLYYAAIESITTSNNYKLATEKERKEFLLEKIK